MRSRAEPHTDELEQFALALVQPLTCIVGYVEMLRDELGELTNDQQLLFDAIGKSSRRLREQIETVLDHAL